MSATNNVPGPQAKRWIERDREILSSSYTREYDFVIDHGSGSIAYDVDGNRYIDFMAGIGTLSTGHCHPKVVEAIRRQAGEFLHICGTDFYYRQTIELAEKLQSIVPMHDKISVCFSNSGTEAVEAALKLARWKTGRKMFIGFYGSFHGRTMGSLSFTSSKSTQRTGFGPLVAGVHHADYSYPYRCPNNCDEEACRRECKCASIIEEKIFGRVADPNEIAAILVEPIQGEGGLVFPADNFLPRLREICTREGILLIVDEVQTGVGRTGKWWAIEHWGVEPDIICIAKGIASGMPIGAIIARKEIMDWPRGSHGSTFAGNPVACAAALATLELIEKGDDKTPPFIDHARTMGDYILNALREMQNRHLSIGRVEGKGLMIGVEIVRDRSTKDRHDRQAGTRLRDDLIASAFRQGLLLLECGTSGVRVTPALNIPREIVDEGLGIFEAALSEAEEKIGLRSRQLVLSSEGDYK